MTTTNDDDLPTTDDSVTDDMLRLHICPECGWERYVPLDHVVIAYTTAAGHWHDLQASL